MVTRTAAGFAHQDVGDTACGIAAGAGLGAVRVVDAHEDVGVAGLEDDELVAANAGVTVGQCGGSGRGEAERAARSSRMTKSLPQPCIFTKVVAMGGI